MELCRPEASVLYTRMRHVTTCLSEDGPPNSANLLSQRT